MSQRYRIGQELKSARLLAGLSQRVVAELSGITQPHLARIEQGKYSSEFDTLQRIAEALHCTITLLPIADE